MRIFLLAALMLASSIQCKAPKEVEPLCDCQKLLEVGGIGIMQGLFRFPECNECPYLLLQPGIEFATFRAICPDSTLTAQLTTNGIVDSTFVNVELRGLKRIDGSRLDCYFTSARDKYDHYAYHIKSIKKM